MRRKPFKKATGTYGRFQDAVKTINPRHQIGGIKTMALFEGYDRRIKQITSTLEEYSIKPPWKRLRQSARKKV